MAAKLVLQLAGGKGLASVVVFSGLAYTMIMRPAMHGSPALTAQAFYYLEELDAVAQLHLEHEDELSPEAIEYLVDNYLFEYSKRNLESRISFKISRSKFWFDDAADYYVGVDQNHTYSLALDVLNDSSVSFVEAIDSEDQVDLSDWNIGVNYVMECFDPYLQQVSKVLDKKIRTLVSPSYDRDGYLGKLRVLKTGHGLVDYWQAVGLNDINLHSIPSIAKTFPLARSSCEHTLDSIPIVRIEARCQHTPVMLSHYFSGLKESNPLKAFVGFYNVLEYYFEEAPILLSRIATREVDQLHCVIELLVTDSDIIYYFSNITTSAQSILTTELPTSSVVSVPAFDPSSGSPRAGLAHWLYDIRCAVIHSKKTRRGRPAAAFEPYSASSQVLHHVVPIVRWLAVACIEKDTALRHVNG